MIIVKDRGNRVNVTHRQMTYQIHAGGRRGLPGEPGVPGEPGEQGPAGEGVPTGGSVGQVLTKQSNADYDTEWEEVPSAPVSSVNGQTGAVVLDQDDISDGVTNKQYSQTEKTKLAGIESGAEVNVQSDWNAVSGDALILNKPAVPATIVESVNGDTGVVVLDKTDIGLSNVDNTSDAAKPVSIAAQTAIDLKANDTDVVHDTGNETIAGVKTFSSDPLIPDEIYGAGWDGSLEPPTKNAVYDKIEAMGSAGITRVVTVTSGSFTAGSSANTDYVYIINGAHTPTMPTAVDNLNRYTFKNNHSANITFLTTGGQTIDGGVLVLGPEESVDLISNSTDWNII